MAEQPVREVDLQELGQYLIRHQIACTPLSDIYSGYDAMNEVVVLVAVGVERCTGHSPAAEASLLRAHALANVRHPNLGNIVSFGSTLDGRPYSVYRFFSDTRLVDLQKKQQAGDTHVAVIDALKIVRQLADALATAREKGICHQDLRPDYIFLEQPDKPVLFNVEFSLSSEKEIPTPDVDESLSAYTSPEERAGKTASVQSNIYSLGVLLYELLAGHRPKIADSPWDIFQKDRQELRQLEPLEDVRPQLSGETLAVVRNCLWREAWNRYESHADLIEAIDRAIIAESTETAVGVRRNIKPLTVGGFLVLLALLLAGSLLVFGRAVPDTENHANSGQLPMQTLASSRPAQVVPVVSDSHCEIELLSPSTGSSFVLGDDISFFWSCVPRPESGESFNIDLFTVAGQDTIDIVPRPSADGLFSLSVSHQRFADNGIVSWQVNLESSTSDDVIAVSERSWFRLELPPTPTFIATSTPSQTTEPTIFSEIACTVEPPPEWTSYRVKDGDTLQDLAALSGESVQTVTEANCLGDASISIGQTLWLPLDISVTVEVNSGGNDVVPASSTPLSTRLPTRQPPTPPSPSATPTVPAPSSTPAPSPPPAPTSPPPPPTQPVPTLTPIAPPPTSPPSTQTPVPPPTMPPATETPIPPPPTLTPVSPL